MDFHGSASILRGDFDIKKPGQTLLCFVIGMMVALALGGCAKPIDTPEAALDRRKNNHHIVSIETVPGWHLVLNAEHAGGDIQLASVYGNSGQVHAWNSMTFPVNPNDRVLVKKIVVDRALTGHVDPAFYSTNHVVDYVYGTAIEEAWIEAYGPKST